MDWQEMKETFSGLVSKSSGGLISTKKEIFNSDSQIRMLLGEEQQLILQKDGEKTCFLDYFIDRRRYPKEAIKQLLLSIPDRDFEKLTYYCSEHIKQRNRITTNSELIDDLSKLLEIIQSVSSNNSDLRYKEAFSVAISNDVSAEQILERILIIPDYQRPYCWREQDVKSFLYDISKWQSSKEKDGINFHAGTLILRKQSEGKFDIIDGQQRLTTLAIFQYTKNAKSNLLQAEKMYCEEEIQTILRAKRCIKSVGYDIELSKIVFSVVEIGEQVPEDMAFTFFSSNNSTGKRLSDYDLLKTHHLRYLPTSKTEEAEFFAEKWHTMENRGHLDDLLQKMMFRLRNWNNRESFAFESANSDNHVLFTHFKSIDPLPDYFICNQTGFRFNSGLSGGREFFFYTEYYYRKYESFKKTESIQMLEKYLMQYSHGVICSGIKAIAFLFYCKFGESFLPDAVYLLSYHLSKLRNNYHVFRRDLGKDEIFRSTTQALDHVTSEAQFFSILNDSSMKYALSNTETAGNYWYSLRNLLKDLEKHLFKKNTIAIPDSFFNPLNIN